MIDTFSEDKERFLLLFDFKLNFFNNLKATKNRFLYPKNFKISFIYYLLFTILKGDVYCLYL